METTVIVITTVRVVESRRPRVPNLITASDDRRTTDHDFVFVLTRKKRNVLLLFIMVV